MKYEGIEFDAATHWAVLMYEANQITPVEETPEMSHWGRVNVGINRALATFLRDRARTVENENL